MTIDYRILVEVEDALEADGIAREFDGDTEYGDALEVNGYGEPGDDE